MWRVRHLLVIAWAALLPLCGPAAALDGTRPGDFLPMREEAPAPEGAGALCRSLDWACAEGWAGGPVGNALLDLADRVNRRANAAIRPVSDLAQYAVTEKWALPSRQGGDCEDYALYKKRELIRAGVAPQRLLIAVVLDRRNVSHAVLVLRSDKGDFVLDNLTDALLPWQQTGLTFLRMQDPRRPARWVAVLARGGAAPSS